MFVLERKPSSVAYGAMGGNEFRRRDLSFGVSKRVSICLLFFGSLCSA
jgi:hypothetical protein